MSQTPLSETDLATFSSTKRKKNDPSCIIHLETIVLTLRSSTTQTKYPSLRYHLAAGLAVTLSDYLDIYECAQNVGWECLIEFPNRIIYPQLVAKFYSNMEFKKDFFGNLLGITTFVQDKEIFIVEKLLVSVFKFEPSMLNLPKCNGYMRFLY